jgi:hypothetical protein
MQSANGGHDGRYLPASMDYTGMSHHPHHSHHHLSSTGDPHAGLHYALPPSAMPPNSHQPHHHLGSKRVTDLDLIGRGGDNASSGKTPAEPLQILTATSDLNPFDCCRRGQLHGHQTYLVWTGYRTWCSHQVQLWGPTDGQENQGKGQNKNGVYWQQTATLHDIFQEENWYHEEGKVDQFIIISYSNDVYPSTHSIFIFFKWLNSPRNYSHFQE